MGGLVSRRESVRRSPLPRRLKHSPQQIAFDEVVRQSIMADPEWRQGDYYEHGQPEKGLAVARMIGHITFMSDQSMEEKFSRKLKNGHYSFEFGADFEVEGYLRNRGDNFVRRFDANSYLYITKAMDYFDLSGGRLIPNGKTHPNPVFDDLLQIGLALPFLPISGYRPGAEKEEGRRHVLRITFDLRA